MLRFLRSLLRRPPIRMGLARDDRGRLRNPRFVSFLAQNNRRTVEFNFHEVVLRGWRLLRFALVVLLVAGVAWVALESARAIGVF